MPGPVDVVIPVRDNLALTRLCLESLDRSPARPRLRLVLVDDGSGPETGAYLRARADAYLRFDRSVGYVRATNAGLAATAGDVLLLNNDVRVSRGALDRMLAAPLDVVGPFTNRVHGSTSDAAQLVEPGYDDPDGMEPFAEELAGANRGRHVRSEHVYFHAALVRRPVLEAVGVLDERFGTGYAEDLDFCRRARAAGFRVGVALDAYVHHECHATFRALGVDVEERMARNARILEEKWRASS